MFPPSMEEHFLNEAQNKLGEDGDEARMRKRADYKAEVHFIGQIEFGTDFDVDEGLFVEAILKFGDHWQVLSPLSPLQTQTSYQDEGK